MSTITLQPKLQISHPPAAPIEKRITLSRVLWVKFLRWIDKASPQAILKQTKRCSIFLLVLGLYCSPQFFLQVALNAMKWNSFKIPGFLALFCILAYWKPAYRWLTRRRNVGNASMYHGIPASELASFLKETGAFKLAEAQSRLRLGEDKCRTIAAELEQHGILTRGEKNARVLRPISYENLVTQLADNFPLAWSDERDCWYEKNGTFERWAINQDFKQRKLTEATERAERRLERARKLTRKEKQLQDWQSPFNQIAALSV